MTDLTTEALFAYASRYASKAEKAGKGTLWPTVRQVRRRFRGVTYDDIVGACEGYSGSGYMGIATGWQAGGMGGGTASITAESDHMVEAYD